MFRYNRYNFSLDIDNIICGVLAVGWLLLYCCCRFGLIFIHVFFIVLDLFSLLFFLSFFFSIFEDLASSIILLTRTWPVPMCTVPRFRTSPRSWSCWRSNPRPPPSACREGSSSGSWKQTCTWPSSCGRLENENSFKN